MATRLENLQREWRLKKQRDKATQTQAAAEIGWTQSAFSQYLSGTTELNPSAIIKLAKYLDVPPSAIDPDMYGDLSCPYCQKKL